MLLPRVIPLLIHSPTSPDFVECDPIYGQDIKPLDCQLAVEVYWPSGNTPIHYYFEDPSPSSAVRLPKYDKQGSCSVTIEAAGPRYGQAHGFPSYLKHRPNELKGLAGYLIEKCAHQGGGIGGFVTVGMDAAERYVAGVANEDWEDMKDWQDGVSNSGTFLTISINGADRTGFLPGDTDPWIPAYLSMYAARLAQPFNEKLSQYQWISFIYHTFSEWMERGGQMSWTSLPSMGFVLQQALDNPGNTRQQEEFDPQIQGRLIGPPGKMVYQCDSSLGGAPDPIDCEKLSWSGLKTPDTVETLEAGVPKFYSEGSRDSYSYLWICNPCDSPQGLERKGLKLYFTNSTNTITQTLGTCALGISSPVAISITWAHILTAFATLNNLCVQNPIKAVKGGRAYYGQQSLNSWFNGKKIKRDSVGGVNGSEALPPGINATIFRHETMSSLPCEWVLAQEGKNLTSCG